MDETQIMAITEKMVVELFKSQINVDLGPFPSMPYSEAMETYGSDKPDLRIPL